MPRFAANITMLFTEMPMEQRFAAVADAGFRGVEILYPYNFEATALRELAKKAGLSIVLINSPPPNWSGGARGFAAVPGMEQQFRHDFDRVLQYANTIHAVHVHLMAGITSSPDARKTFLDNLNWAVKRAPHTSLLLEPINQNERPGCYLSTFDLAAEIITEINAPNLGLQFDISHAHAITGDVIGTWTKHAPLIRHVQIAGFPDRREPDLTSFDFPGFFNILDRSGYRGWIGAEYAPQRLTEASLGWMPGR